MLNRPTTEERLGKSPQRLVRYFVMVMAAVYIGLGVWLWYSASQPVGAGLLQMGPTGRIILGAVFILYGAVRFYRGYQAHFSKTNTLDEHD
jgi:hypothetical protein